MTVTRRRARERVCRRLRSRAARRVRIALALAFLPIAAYAQQETQDREEFDRAAGRAVFSRVPLAESKPFDFRPASQKSDTLVRNPRGVRVILASPYGR